MINLYNFIYDMENGLYITLNKYSKFDRFTYEQFQEEVQYKSFEDDLKVNYDKCLC